MNKGEKILYNNNIEIIKDIKYNDNSCCDILNIDIEIIFKSGKMYYDEIEEYDSLLSKDEAKEILINNFLEKIKEN